MALSQKHPGKILVPWFNNDEWKKTCELIYSENNSDQQKGMVTLKIWKSRVSHLPAGVEGTLIVLEALLTNRTYFDPTNESAVECLKSVYSNALLRFLNICATSSDRQGNFLKEAEKNDIPRWLIGYRHEIAHSHNLPSLDILKTCLNFCFNWLKEKYWEDESFKSEDYIVKTGEEEEQSTNKQKKKSAHSTKLTSILKKVPEPHPNIHLIERILYDTTCETADDGSKYFPGHILEEWSCLLDSIYLQNSIGVLINKLLKVTRHPLREPSQRETAATWLSEIFKGLIRIKMTREYLHASHQSVIDISELPQEIEDQFPEILKFTVSFEEKFKEEEIQKIIDDVLNDPNEYTLIYLNNMLLLNVNVQLSKQFMTNIVNYVSTQPSNLSTTQILTTEDLEDNFDDSVNDVEPIFENYENCSRINNKRTPVENSRWTKIIDTSSFEGCPLGILPGQYTDKNPSMFF